MAEKTQITCYVMKTKEKNVVMQDAVIFRRKRTRGTGFSYQAQGNDGKGNKCCAMLGEAKALAAITDKTATKDAATWAESGK